MNKKEIIKLQQEQKTKGLVIISVKLFLNSRNLAKIAIALATGKKIYDNRNLLLLLFNISIIIRTVYTVSTAFWLVTRNYLFSSSPMKRV